MPRIGRACRSGRRAAPRAGCGGPGRRRGRRPRGRTRPTTSASTSMLTGEVELRHPAEAALLVVVEQLVRRVHRLGERRRRHHVGEPDERDLHGHLLDQQRQPAGGAAAGGVRRRRARPGRPGATGGLHPAAGTGRRPDRPAGRAGRGHRQRPTRTTRSPGWPAIVREVTRPGGRRWSPRRSSWRAGPSPSASRSTPSMTSRPSRAVERAAQGTRGWSRPGAVSRPELVAGRRRARRRCVRRPWALTQVDGRGRGPRDVAHQQRLAAAGRARRR